MQPEKLHILHAEMEELNWNDLRYFLAAFEQRSISGAAKALGVQQSTMSRRLAALEESLGASLFYRSPTGLIPSDLAHSIHPEAARIESSFSTMNYIAAGESEELSGKVRISLAEPLALELVLPRLEGILSRYPGLKLEFVTGYELVDLARREADIALRFAAPKKGALIYQKVAEVQYIAAARRELFGRYAKGEPKSLPWIGLDHDMEDTLEGKWLNAAIGAEPRFRVNSYLMQMKAVEAGLGAALVPRFLVHQEPGLVEIDCQHPLPKPMPLYIVTHERLRKIPRIEAIWRELIRLCSFLH